MRTFIFALAAIVPVSCLSHAGRHRHHCLDFALAPSKKAIPDFDPERLRGRAELGLSLRFEIGHTNDADKTKSFDRILVDLIEPAASLAPDIADACRPCSRSSDSP